jgi:membrane glycosyltransferase
MVLCLLFLPKVLAYLGTVLHPRRRRSFGNGFSLTIGVMMEALLSALLAPSVMVSHTLMVLGMVLGHSVKWGNQTRETDGTSWGEALRYHGPAIVLGVVWTGVASYVGDSFLYWMSPILAGLLLAATVSVWTSRSRYGKALQARHILATPEELNPPAVLEIADLAVAAVDPALTAQAPAREGVIAAVVDPYVNGVHVSLLEQDAENFPEASMERWLAEGSEALDKNEMTEVMYSASAMLQMHRSVWSRPFEQMHPQWSRAVESYRTKIEDMTAGER